MTAVATDDYGYGTTSSPVAVTVKPGELQPYYIHADQLDTPREITDTNANVVWQWNNQDPFGNNIPNENPSNQGVFKFNQRFPGQYYDTETNLAYNVNRDYDPSIGRYIQSDPIGLAGGINTYTYVGGNPLSRIDPDGLSVATIGGGLILLGGYELWSKYSEIQDCKKECKEKHQCEIDKGNTGPYHACEAQCVLKFWGGGKLKPGPVGPTPEDPFP